MELVSHGADNPEQRIEQDVNFFTQQTLTIVLGLLSEVMTLVTFTVVLWQLSGGLCPADLRRHQDPRLHDVGGHHLRAIGSWLTYKIGRPLVQVNFDLERYNADFRYRMTRVRENAESIALYKGEPDEERRLRGAFGRIYETWWEYMVYNKRLTWLTAFYGQVASIFPILVATPALLRRRGPAGRPDPDRQRLRPCAGLAVLVRRCLADARRLEGHHRPAHHLQRGHGAGSRRPRQAPRARSTVGSQPGLELRDVDVRCRTGTCCWRAWMSASPRARRSSSRALRQRQDHAVPRPRRLWPFGRGTVQLPADARVLFLPQRPYIPIGTLARHYATPMSPAHDDREIAEALAVCQLEHLTERLDESANWSLMLSGGEQQRLAFARAVLVRPDWLFLDEATSALDEATETRLYELLDARLPDATLVSIAHKPSVARFHEQRLRIDPGQRRVLSEPLEPAGQGG